MRAPAFKMWMGWVVVLALAVVLGWIVVTSHHDGTNPCGDIP
jgi:hypothetical protein